MKVWLGELIQKSILIKSSSQKLKFDKINTNEQKKNSNEKIRSFLIRSYNSPETY